MFAEPVGRHGVAGFVNGNGVLFTVGVGNAFARTEVLEVLGMNDVLPADHIRSTTDCRDQSLVDQVLDLGTGGVGRRGRETIDVLDAEIVVHLRQVTLVGTGTAFLGRVADTVDAVDTTRTQQRRVERIGHIRRHHHEDAVLRRLFRPHTEAATDDPVEESSRLLETLEFGEQRLERSGTGTASHHAAHHDLVTAAGYRVHTRSREVPGGVA